MQDIQVEFGWRVRVARVERSWTQARLAERLHTTTRTVSKIERGQTNISLDTIRAYACELDLSLDDLIRDASPDRIPYCAARYFAGMPAGAAIALSNIGGTPLLIYRRWETILRERFERMGVAPCVKCVSDSAITTMALAAAGMGVALVPASTLAGADFSGLEQREIAGLGVSSEIAAVYRSEAELTAAAREFLAELPHCGDD